MFDLSVTFNQWTRMTCHDISLVESYESLYGCPYEPPYGQSLIRPEAPFFFKNHPINYVSLCGRVRQVAQKADNFWIVTIDDGTGTEVDVKFRRSRSPVRIHEFIEVRGHIVDHKKYGRGVYPRDIWRFGDVSLEEEFLAYMEAIRLRRHILSATWCLPDEPSILLSPAKQVHSYCSLDRVPSSLVNHPEHMDAIGNPEMSARCRHVDFDVPTVQNFMAF